MVLMIKLVNHAKKFHSMLFLGNWLAVLYSLAKNGMRYSHNQKNHINFHGDISGGRDGALL